MIIKWVDYNIGMCPITLLVIVPWNNVNIAVMTFTLFS
jgi:hypothetical protein